MSWPYPFSYHAQLGTSQFMNPMNPFETQLMLHLLSQRPPMDSLSSSPFLNMQLNFNPFSSPFDRNQLMTFGHCETLPTVCNQLPFNELIIPQLKKQQSVSSLEDNSNQSQNNQLPLEKLSQHFQGGHSILKKKNFISHNCSLRNDTKNIPKNYGKAMLSYIQKNSREVKEILAKHSVDYLQFMIFVKSFKSKINTMHDLREMWGQNEISDKYKKCTRILSYHFMRKKCLPYIFNSRIKNFHTHIKYRKKIMEGIQNPQNFTKIKEF